ncbi:1337_t:CDS:2, partial [Diversispora eburnea]
MAENGDADSPTDTINPAFPDESPTLPPTPGDHNGQENYDPTPLPSSTSSQNQSSISSPSFTDSQRNIPEQTTFERLDRLQSTSAFSNNPNSPYTINSSHYFHVTSPLSQPQFPQHHQTSALISPSPSSPGRAPNRILTPQSMSSNQRDSIASESQSPTPNRRHPSHHYRGEGRRNHHGEPHIPLTPPVPVPPAPAPAMYWSKIRTFGKVPKPLRSHTAILVEEQVFVFGGCDSRTCFNSVYVFDADTMYWNKPRTLGDPPPPCRAHSSTKVGKKLYIFGGGDGPTYFNDLYIFDTDTLTWTKPQTSGDTPTPRRAHTTEHYNNCIYIFGGGDGVCALNDVYMLDISDLSNLIWKKLEPSGGPPISRGYHTSNLVDNKLVVFGGSDGHECFDDVYVLDL